MKHLRSVRKLVCALSVAIILSLQIQAGSASDCGQQAGGKLCPGYRCCSRWGWCGDGQEYCGAGCQSQCDGPPAESIASIIDENTFNQIFEHAEDVVCDASGFYAYGDFIEAAKSFPSFGETGDLDTRKREIAAFLAQSGYETSRGYKCPPNLYNYGYCFISGQDSYDDDFCEKSRAYPCHSGAKYYPRGPLQIKGNVQYGEAGEYLGYNLLEKPELLETNSTVSFEAALWYWTESGDWNRRPSAHDIVTGSWEPSGLDKMGKRVQGYGAITNTLAGDVCGHGPNVEDTDRIGYYRRICELLDVDTGDNLSCAYQIPFGKNLPFGASIMNM